MIGSIAASAPTVHAAPCLEISFTVSTICEGIMSDHPYLPKGLPLLPDHVLLKTYRVYRRTCVMYDEAERLDASVVAPQLTALRDATAQIEEELHARGIGAEPWWSEQATHQERWRLEEMLM